MRSRTRTGVLARTVAVVALFVLAGCSSGPATIEQDPDTGRSGTSASAPAGSDGAQALRTKFRFFTQDACYSADPAEAFGRCARFTTEIRNVLGQVRQDVPAATAQADATEQALDGFASAGCEAEPGTVGGGDPATCAPAYRQVQEAVQGLATAVGAPR
ncbi:hypothetical protein [Pseudonocardia ammonioxydans]|uniref:hypothetical protein n=1 Tax=Pseudonocardia ammonioxydans TaxID=260086 RepID=UPI001160C5A9|nr:hypothetical protein [Pseudonocardia ammonioxydans]